MSCLKDRFEIMIYKLSQTHDFKDKFDTMLNYKCT